MKKKLVSLLLAAVCFLAGSLLASKLVLGRDVVRLHVVAASDSRGDQAKKLLVRDAVLRQLDTVSRDSLEGALPALQDTAQAALRAAGSGEDVRVSLGRERFETRQGEDCALPAGIYETLRVTIGAGQGHNWWGVVFPKACGEIAEPVWSGEQKPVRFFLLEKLGQAETWLDEKLSSLLDRE